MRKRGWLIGCTLFALLACHPGLAYTVPTHQYLVSASIQQLRVDSATALVQYDGKRAEALYLAAEFWQLYETKMRQGASDVDLNPFMFTPATIPFQHGWNPWTERGWFGYMGASGVSDILEGKAIQAFYDENYELMGWYTGAALHLLHDLTVPFHSKCSTNTRRHSKFEETAESLMQQIVPLPGGIYTFADLTEDDLVFYTIGLWVREAANKSIDLYPLVGPMDELAERADEPVSIVQMHDAIRRGAGYLLAMYRFLNNK